MSYTIRRTLRGALLASIVCTRFCSAESRASTNAPVLMTPMTIYGGDYRILPGAASLNVLTAEPLPGDALATTRDLTALAPNFGVLDGNNNRMPRFSVRGLRENNFVTGDPAVGLYLDDVPCADLFSRSLTLHNAESVEFIRGPQGTLYGASGPGGVVNITSRQPGEVWHGNAGYTHGSFQTHAADATISGPIVANRLGLGVSGIYSIREGFVHNAYDGSHPDDQQTLAGRAQLQWTPATPWEISLLASGQRFNDGFVPTFNPATDRGFFDVARDFPGHVDTETWNMALKAAWSGENVKATSVTSFRSWRQDLAQDFDFGTNPFGATVGFFRPVVRQWTEELRFRSLSDGSLRWNAGLYGSWGETENASGRHVTIPFYGVDTSTTRSTLEAATYALFGEATYTVREKLDLIAGLRLSHDERELSRRRDGVDLFGGTGPFAVPAFTLRDSFTSAQPKLGLAYHFQPECVMYATVSAGYQSGGFNVSNDNAAQAGFDPARSWHYELGVRTLWLDRRLEFNTALFCTDTRDYQVYRLSESDPAQAWLLNADRVLSWGVEAELIARPTANLAVSLLAGHVQARFERFADAYNDRRPEFDGNDVNFVPQFTATLAVDYKLPRGFYVRGEAVGVGEFQLDEANTAQQDAYALLNGRLGYRYRNFEIYVFGRNLTDEHYAANALDFRPFSGIILQPGDPRCLGMGVSAEF